MKAGYFEVRALVDIANLGDVKAALQLQGKCLHLADVFVPTDVAVANMAKGKKKSQVELLPAPKKAKRKSPTPADGRPSRLTIVRDAVMKLASQGKTQITTAEVNKMVDVPSNYVSMLLTNLCEEKVIKRTSIGIFKILRVEAEQGAA